MSTLRWSPGGPPTECISALARRRREGRLPARSETAARRALDALAASWSEILPGDGLRQGAERLLTVHPLRAADAFQLAAALVWARGEPQGRILVSVNDRLREAAEREGFEVVPERR